MKKCCFNCKYFELVEGLTLALFYQSLLSSTDNDLAGKCKYPVPPLPSSYIKADYVGAYFQGDRCPVWEKKEDEIDEEVKE